MYKDESIKTFLDDLASPKSSPGGGSAVALAGGTVAAVICFICNMTIGRQRYKDAEEEANVILQEASELQREFLEYIDEDKAILDQILESYKQRQTDHDRFIAVSKKAVGFSLAMAGKCLRMLELVLQVSRIGNRVLLSDFEVALHLGFAAVNGSVSNVKINLSGIEDREFSDAADRECSRLLSEAENIRQKTSELVNDLKK